MFGKAKEVYETTVREIREAGLYKEERIITTPQSAEIGVGTGENQRHVLNFCANNYLGLSSHPDVIKAAHQRDRHARLRDELGALHLRHPGPPQEPRGEDLARSSAPRTRSSTPPASTRTAASSRRCSAKRTRSSPTRSTTHRSSTASASARRSATATPTATWPRSRSALKETQGKRLRMIATDGVFSMDGYLAKLDEICDLADKYEAMVMVDDSHASGFIGKTGRGTPEHFGVQSRVDVMTSTLGKALGGAAGGFTTGQEGDRRAPAPALAALPLLELDRRRRSPARRSRSSICSSGTTELRDRLMSNAKRFRDGMIEGAASRSRRASRPSSR